MSKYNAKQFLLPPGDYLCCKNKLLKLVTGKDTASPPQSKNAGNFYRMSKTARPEWPWKQISRSSWAYRHKGII